MRNVRPLSICEAPPVGGHGGPSTGSAKKQLKLKTMKTLNSFFSKAANFKIDPYCSQQVLFPYPFCSQQVLVSDPYCTKQTNCAGDTGIVSLTCICNMWIYISVTCNIVPLWQVELCLCDTWNCLCGIIFVICVGDVWNCLRDMYL